MSYTLTAFSVDLDELRRVVGGRNGALVQSVMDYHPEAFSDNEESEEEEITLRQALTEIIDGRLTDPRSSAHQLWLRPAGAVRLPRRGARELVRHPLVGDGADRDGPPAGAVRIAGSPARQPGRLPALGFIPRADFPKRLEELAPRLGAADEDFEPLYLQYRGWLEDAAAANRDLVFFYS